MKAYSIGREAGCDITINDSTDVISRRHAILNVAPSGKMTIVDQSSNGTYVNGIRISPNVPVPVTRKDNVSFAHVARLDWNLIPKQVSVMQYVIIGAIALAVIIGCIVAYMLLSEPKNGSNNETPTVDTEQTDSCQTCKKAVPECEYKGKHPEGEKTDTCQTCKKPVTDCSYNGKHPVDTVRKKQQPKKTEKRQGKQPDKKKVPAKPAKKKEDVSAGDRHG